MPMDFPTMKSLKMAAEVHGFRQPFEPSADDEFRMDPETEADYREALAKHVEPRDFIEAQEIRNKVGWDQFSGEQNDAMLNRMIKGKSQ